MPRIPSNYLDCVFYLFDSHADALAGVKSGGTGFLVSVPSAMFPERFSHVYAVTNWHVACRGSSVIRLMRRDGTPEIFDFAPHDWTFDPSGHDIAVIRIDAGPDKYKVAHAPIAGCVSKERLTSDRIGVGEDVFMIGRFVDHAGGDGNTPTARFGNISMLPTPLEQPNGNKRDTYCLDMHSRTGFSGSPVFIYRMPGWDMEKMDKGVEISGNGYLMLLGIHYGQFGEVWRLVRDPKKNALGSDVAEAVELVETDGHVIGVSGMTKVAPAWAIEELLNVQKLRDARAASEARAADLVVKGTFSEPSVPDSGGRTVI